MELEDALELIEETLESEFRYHLEEGLPEGAYEEWQYDESLIIDIAKAIQRWKTRTGK
jgi:hypothetical protein